MKAIVKRSDGLFGEIIVPPSKSQSMRALIFASLAHGKSKIYSPLFTDDFLYAIECLNNIGAFISYDMSKKIVEIIGNSGKLNINNNNFYVGNSGILLRFLSAILAFSKMSVLITGDERLCSTRSIQEIISAVNQLGGKAFSKNIKGYPPLCIKGPVHNGNVSINGSDSQPVSGLLIASLLGKGIMDLNVDSAGEKPWINMTLEWFDRLFLKYENKNFERYIVPGNQMIKSFEYRVSGDFSSALFPVLCGLLLPDSKIEIKNLNFNDSQGDKEVFQILKKMGAYLKRSSNSLEVRYSKLKGMEIDVNGIIDALPALAVAGCFAKGRTILKNAGIARKKECDRIDAISKELSKMGAKILTTEDSMIIDGTDLKGATLNSHNDHRIALSLIVAGLVASNETIIEDINCIDKTYSEFPKNISNIGGNIKIE